MAWVSDSGEGVAARSDRDRGPLPHGPVGEPGRHRGPSTHPARSTGPPEPQGRPALRRSSAAAGLSARNGSATQRSTLRLPKLTCPKSIGCHACTELLTCTGGVAAHEAATPRVAHRPRRQQQPLDTTRGRSTPQHRTASPRTAHADGDRFCWSQLTWISGATVKLLSWWILSYLIGVRISRAVWRRCRLWKMSRYSKIALANSTRVRHQRRSRSSTCIRAQTVPSTHRNSPRRISLRERGRTGGPGL